MARGKPSERLFPNFVPAVISVGNARLQQIAKAADISIDDLPKGDMLAIAKRLMGRLKEPAYFLHHVNADDEAKMAVALGVPTEASWKKSNPVTPEILAMQDYARPSWQKTVWDAFQLKAEPTRSKPRTTAQRDPQFSSQWPELANPKAWKKLDSAARKQFAKELAKALGKDFAVSKTDAGLVAHQPTGITYVPIPGGKYSMGLSKEEQAALRKNLKGDPEALELLKGYAMQVRPDHGVQLPAFLCSKSPLLEEHTKNRVEADSANPHRVSRMTREQAAEAITKIGARLLTESEWEWTARADGARLWLVAGDAPRDGIATLSSDPDISKDVHPLGISGLAWGTWVDDGWQPTYKKAPIDGSAFTPLELPEVVRGGGLDLWPWQGVGEAMMTHVTFRDLDRLGDHAVLVARDLPRR